MIFNHSVLARDYPKKGFHAVSDSLANQDTVAALLRVLTGFQQSYVVNVFELYHTHNVIKYKFLVFRFGYLINTSVVAL